MTTPLLALTVQHPWALALALGIKPIENRDWRYPSPASFIGQRIALHASKVVPRDARDLVEELVLDELWTDETFADLDAVMAELRRTAGCIVAVGTLARVVEHGDGDPLNSDPWRTEARFGLVLTDVVRLAEPVPAKGALGFWRVPAATAGCVEARAVAAMDVERERRRGAREKYIASGLSRDPLLMEAVIRGGR